MSDSEPEDRTTDVPNSERRQIAAQLLRQARKEMDGVGDTTLLDEVCVIGLSFIEELLLRNE